MKRIFTLLVLTITFSQSYSQRLEVVKLSAGSDFQYFGITVSQDGIMRISDKGELLEYGVEREVAQYNYVSPNLLPFMGRADKYGQEALPDLQGKLKSLGTTYIKWYTSMDQEYQAGKIKSIGNSQIDYYSNFSDKAYAGKIKNIGSMRFEYYSSFDNAALTGKLKSVGSNRLQYYTTFDDKLVAGKMKSIGTYNYQWYGERDSREYRGGIKMGSPRQTINGIVFDIL